MPKRTAVQLSQKLVQALQYEGDIRTNEGGKNIEPRYVKWDGGNDGVKGLGIRVYPSGKKAWVFAYPVEGRKRLMQLGTFPELTLDEARKTARSHGGEIAKAEALNEEPVDPLAKRELDRDALTFGELCAEYLNRHGPTKKTVSEDKRRINTHLIPAWGALKAKTIKRGDVARLHHTVGERGHYEANRVLALASTIFQKGTEWGLLPDNHPNPARGIQTFKEVKRDRWVRPEELPRLAAAIDRAPNPYVRGLLWAYLLTGARKTELLTLQWADVDFIRHELHIPDTKQGKPHYIPLSHAAEALLASIPRILDNPYVFPGRGDGVHMVNIGDSWREIRKEAGLEDVRLHDLRRTVGSWLATSGASLPLIGKVLGHTQPSTTAIYARLAEDPARQALEEHGERIMEAAKGLRAVK